MYGKWPYLLCWFLALGEEGGGGKMAKGAKAKNIKEEYVGVQPVAALRCT